MKNLYRHIYGFVIACFAMYFVIKNDLPITNLLLSFIILNELNIMQNSK